MPRHNRQTNLTTGHHGLSPSMDIYNANKDITKEPKPRRLNEYTIIPRRPRHHPQNPHDYVLTTIKPDHVTHVQATLEPPQKDLSGSSVDVTEEKRERSWSFKKIRNALFRSKSLGKCKEDHPSKPVKDSDTRKSVSEPAGVLFSTTPDKDVKHFGYRQDRLPRQVDDDIYAELDLVSSSPNLHRESSDLSRHSGGTGSSASMAGLSGLDTATSGLESSDASSRSGVFKVISSQLKNLTSRKKTSTKHHKQSVENPEYSSSTFSRGDYRGSFKDVPSPTKPYNDCRRTRSFTSPSKQHFRTAARQAEAPEDPSYSMQMDYDGNKGIYSLARSDSPPPLPERTYLKLRKEAKKENVIPLRSQLIGYDAKGKCVRFGVTENNNVCYESSQATSHDHQDDSRPYHATTAIPFPVQTAEPKPFSLHDHLRRDCGSSSGYGSVNSETYSIDSCDQTLPTKVCKLPKRSKRLSTTGPVSSKHGDLPGHYGNRQLDLLQVPSSSHPTPIPQRKTSTGTISDCSLLRNKVHNLPLLPYECTVELVRTIHLKHVLKDKWISGIAVTRRNELIVVDQREAYLLDENGVLKKSIGSKGAGRLIEPLNVTVMPTNDNLVICDHAEQDLKIFSWKGQYIRKICDPGLTNIAGIVAMDDKSIAIAGTDKKRVSVLDEEGKLLYTIPGGIQDASQNISPKPKSPFEHPYSIAVNPLTGDIIIGDDNKQVVTAVTPSRDGDVAKIRWRYSPMSGERHFFPSSICADHNGYIFIADLYNEVVYMLDSGGKFIKTLLSRGNGLNGGPGAIATDSKGHLLVADEERSIKVFRYGSENGFSVSQRYSFCPDTSL